MGPAVFGADGAGHEDHSIDQLGAGLRGHGLVAAMKLGLVEPLALDERRHGDADGPLGGAHRGVSGRTIQGQQGAIRTATPLRP